MSKISCRIEIEMNPDLILDTIHALESKRDGSWSEDARIYQVLIDEAEELDPTTAPSIGLAQEIFMMLCSRAGFGGSNGHDEWLCYEGRDSL